MNSAIEHDNAIDEKLIRDHVSWIPTAACPRDAWPSKPFPVKAGSGLQGENDGIDVLRCQSKDHERG
jgi:hypothetical protein